MKYTPAEKMQMEAIYNPNGVTYFEFGDLISLSNSTAGVYIKKEDVRIDLTKIFLTEGEKKEIINPSRLWKQSVMAEKEATGKEHTKYWIITGEDGKRAYVKDHIMKLFGNGARCRIEGYSKPILIVKNRNIPIGYVFPFVRNEDLKDKKIAEEWENSKDSYFWVDRGEQGMNIDLSRFKVVYGEKVLNAISLQSVEFDRDWEKHQANLMNKPKFIAILAINEDGNIIEIHDEAWMFQFIPIVQK